MLFETVNKHVQIVCVLQSFHQSVSPLGIHRPHMYSHTVLDMFQIWMSQSCGLVAITVTWSFSLLQRSSIVGWIQLEYASNRCGQTETNNTTSNISTTTDFPKRFVKQHTNNITKLSCPSISSEQQLNLVYDHTWHIAYTHIHTYCTLVEWECNSSLSNANSTVEFDVQIYMCLNSMQAAKLQQSSEETKQFLHLFCVSTVRADWNAIYYTP